jgi:hypothetical protein
MGRQRNGNQKSKGDKKNGGANPAHHNGQQKGVGGQKKSVNGNFKRQKRKKH